MSDERTTRGLSNKEKQLVLFIREFGWGDMKIRVENGEPVLIYEAVKTIRLDDKPLNLKNTRQRNDGDATIKKHKNYNLISFNQLTIKHFFVTFHSIIKELMMAESNNDRPVNLASHLARLTGLLFFVPCSENNWVLDK